MIQTGIEDKETFFPVNDNFDNHHLHSKMKRNLVKEFAFGYNTFIPFGYHFSSYATMK